MHKDARIYRRYIRFKEFQPLNCTNVELSFGTTVHFDMNGFLNSNPRLGNASLWINADYWRIYFNDQLKLDSDSIDTNDTKILKQLFLNKSFIEVRDVKNPNALVIVFDEIKIEVVKPEDEVYDLVNIFLPNGEIIYYTDALYKSHQTDDERYSQQKEITINKFPKNYLVKLKDTISVYLHEKKQAYIRFGITGNIKKQNVPDKIQPNFQIEVDNQLFSYSGFKLKDKPFRTKSLSKKYLISEIYAIQRGMKKGKKGDAAFF